MAPRIAVPRFVGGTLRLLSQQAADERTINWYPETTGGGGKVQRMLRPTEGVRKLLIVPGYTDTHAMFCQDELVWALVGASFQQIDPIGVSSTFRGAVSYDGVRGTIVTNGSAGNQVALCSGGAVYIWNTQTSTFSTATDLAGIYITQLEFMDGYFFAVVRDSRRVYFCALEDGTSWDTTFDYFERSWGSDDIQFIKRTGRQLYVVGTATSEIWADAGNATNPWAPIQGAFMDVGAIGPQCGVRDGETLIWVAQDERGGAQVIRAAGYQPKEVSSYGIVNTLQGLGQNTKQSEALSMQIGGHGLYWLYIPTNDTTLVYDLKENEWHERARWNKVHAVWRPHPARSHCYAFQSHLLGVEDTGVIYTLSAAYVTDEWGE
jgi:hypothetical protein